LLSDLHLHSFNSDGEATYSELIQRAKALGLDAVSLTDHDTFGGVRDFLDECQKQNLKAISGIEISAFKDAEIHILGYNIDPEADNPVNRELGNLARARVKRIKMILDKLKKLNILISYDEILQYYKTRSVSRTHIANLMVLKGYVKTKAEAFELYLSPNRPAFVDFYYFAPQEAVDIINQSGGVPVLAHPFRINLDKTDLKDLVKRLADAGLKGIESYYPTHSNDTINFCKKLAEKYNLINTNGSDTHNIYDNLITNFETEQKTIEVLGLR
jgi:predicted metal-dependent phosphoesterase TrpH